MVKNSVARLAKGSSAARGEVCVSIVAQTEAVVAQTYYNGAKESERPAVANLLNDNGLLNKRIVLDALHLVPTLLDAIHLANGTYLIGLKANHFLLQQACLIQTLLHKPLFERVNAPCGRMVVSRNVPTGVSRW